MTVTFNSSVIKEVTYDKDTEDLIVVFNSGAKYTYPNFPEDLFHEWSTVESAGRFYNKNVRGRVFSSKSLLKGGSAI